MYDYNNLPFPVTRVFTDSYGNKHVFLDTRYYAGAKGGGFLGKVSSFFKGVGGNKAPKKTALGSNNRKGSLFSLDKKFKPLNNTSTPKPGKRIKIETPKGISDSMKNMNKGPVSATKALEDATKKINDQIAKNKGLPGSVTQTPTSISGAEAKRGGTADFVYGNNHFEVKSPTNTNHQAPKSIAGAGATTTQPKVEAPKQPEVKAPEPPKVESSPTPPPPPAPTNTTTAPPNPEPPKDTTQKTPPPPSSDNKTTTSGAPKIEAPEQPKPEPTSIAGAGAGGGRPDGQNNTQLGNQHVGQNQTSTTATNPGTTTGQTTTTATNNNSTTGNNPSSIAGAGATDNKSTTTGQTTQSTSSTTTDSNQNQNQSNLSKRDQEFIKKAQEQEAINKQKAAEKEKWRQEYRDKRDKGESVSTGETLKYWGDKAKRNGAACLTIMTVIMVKSITVWAKTIIRTKARWLLPCL